MTLERHERRRVPRTRASIGVVVVSDGGTTRLEARIRNLSPAGALVELPGAERLDGDVYLLLPEHQIQPCRMIWQKGDELGLSYVDPQAD